MTSRYQLLFGLVSISISILLTENLISAKPVESTRATPTASSNNTLSDSKRVAECIRGCYATALSEIESNGATIVRDGVQCDINHCGSHLQNGADCGACGPENLQDCRDCHRRASKTHSSRHAEIEAEKDACITRCQTGEVTSPRPIDSSPSNTNNSNSLNQGEIVNTR